MKNIDDAPFVSEIAQAFAKYDATMAEIAKTDPVGMARFNLVLVDASPLNLIKGIKPERFLGVCDGPHYRGRDFICGFGSAA